MYSDGIIENEKTEVLEDNSLPDDVMLLYKLEDLDTFYDSKKDLALCTIETPPNTLNFLKNGC